MSPGLVFGQVAPCRRCDGRGQVKHQKDAAAARERARLRRMGREVADPPPIRSVPALRRQGLAADRRSGRAGGAVMACA